MEGDRVISNVPIDNLFVALDYPVEQEGCYNAGVQVCKERATGRVMVRKKMAIGHEHPDAPPTGPSDWYREMKISSSLRHKNIVEFFRGYVNVQHQHASIYMEVCDLGTLEEFIKGCSLLRIRPIPTMFIWHVTRSLIDAVVYLHYGIDTSSYPIYSGEEGMEVNPRWDPILHRDVHIGNVLLQSSKKGRYPIVKVGDFGCALSLRDDAPLWNATPGSIVGGRPIDGGYREAINHDLHGIGLIMRMLCYGTIFEEALPPCSYEVLGAEWPYAFHDMARLLLKGGISAMMALDGWQNHHQTEIWPPRIDLDPRAFKRIMRPVDK